MTQYGAPTGGSAGFGQQPGYTAPPGYGAPPPPTGYPLPGGYQPPPGYGVPPPRHPQEVSDAALAHYLGIIGWIGPLIIFLTKGNQSPHVRAHAVEALNFQISMTIYAFAGGLVLGCLAILTFGLSLLGLLLPLVLQIVFAVIAGNTAKQGGFYQYPATIRMVS